MNNNAINKGLPVGVFDSGIGGLSVVAPLLDKIPVDQILYVADSEYAPYGELTDEDVLKRSEKITRFLIEQGAQSMVIACNTATAIAVDYLRKKFDIPIVAMEPAIKPAMALSQTKTIAVLATAGTLSSDRYSALEKQHGANGQVLSCACHGWVKQVETDDVQSEKTKSLIKKSLLPLIETNVDVFVLGCTHYPFFEVAIKQLFDREVIIINPAPAVVEQLIRVTGIEFAKSALHNNSQCIKVWVTKKNDAYQKKIESLIGHKTQFQFLEL